MLTLLSSLIAQTGGVPSQADFGQPIKGAGDRFSDPSIVTDSSGFTVALQFEKIISLGISVLTIVGGLFFLMYFFLGALKWVTAGGDGGKVGKARDEMIQGVIGMIVVVAAYGIVGLIGTVVGLNILQPATQIIKLLRP